MYSHLGQAKCVHHIVTHATTFAFSLEVSYFQVCLLMLLAKGVIIVKRDAFEFRETLTVTSIMSLIKTKLKLDTKFRREEGRWPMMKHTYVFSVRPVLPISTPAQPVG